MARVVKKEENMKHILNLKTPTIEATTDISVFTLLDYDEILRLNMDEITETDIKELGEILNINMMRRIMHVDVLHTIVMRTIASGYHPYMTWMLTNYYESFIEIYRNKKTTPLLNNYELFKQMDDELKIDDAISRIPNFRPHERIIVGSIWLDIETIVSMLSVVLSKHVFDEDVFCAAIKNCVDDNFKKVTSAMSLEIRQMYVVKSGVSTDE